jgi:hypothetical protein
MSPTSITTSLGNPVVQNLTTNTTKRKTSEIITGNSESPRGRDKEQWLTTLGLSGWDAAAPPPEPSPSCPSSSCSPASLQL